MVFVHALPPGLRFADLLDELAQHYLPAVAFVRVLRCPQAAPAAAVAAAHQDAQHALLIYFRSSLDARNFYERTHLSTAPQSLGPLYCHFVLEVHLSVARQDNEIHELPPSADHFRDLGYVLLPKCTFCLLRLDERFSGIALPNGFPGDLPAGLRPPCTTCQSVERAENLCRHCHSAHDIW